MVGNLLAAFVLNVATSSSALAEPYIPNDRVLPEVHAQIERATEGYYSGDWNRTIACSDVVLFVDAIGYKVDFYGDSEKSLERQRKALRNAMQMWEQALSYQIRFEESDNPIVSIKFQDSVQNRGREVGGHIKWRRDVSLGVNGLFAPNVKADIWIRTEQPNGRDMSIDAMKHVASHEIGHVLGLRDSQTIGDIMGPLDMRRPVRNLGDHEISALNSARERASMLRQISLQSASREADGYNLARAAR